MKPSASTNPFAISRAEHMGDELYRYFAGENIFGNLLSQKPLVMEGGRGSGKTMFFLYNTHFSKKLQNIANNLPPHHHVDTDTILGIYIKAAPDIVTGFTKKSRDEDWWITAFSHYLTLNVCRGMLEIVKDIFAARPAATNDSAQYLAELARSLLVTPNAIPTIAHAIQYLDNAEVQFFTHINNISAVTPPIGG